MLLLLGLLLLIKGSDFLVSASSRLAKKLGISDFIIGLTVVAIGTSIPELATAISAALKSASGIIVGNVVGANIANIGLNIGLASLFGTVVVKKDMLKRDGYIMLLIGLIFVMLAFDHAVAPWEGLILLLIYFSYVLFLVQARDDIGKNMQVAEFIDYFLKFRYLSTIRSHAIRMFNREKPKTAEEKKMTQLFREGLLKDGFIIFLSIFAVGYGANIIVREALNLATQLNVLPVFIGSTIISLGTTLPELGVSITAMRKKLGALALGNVIGSNIANIGLIFGIGSIINHVVLSDVSVNFLIPAMLTFFATFVFFIRTNLKISKKEGAILLGMYLLFISTMIFLA